MTTIRNVLREKGFQILSVPPTVTVLEALQVMAENNIGAVLVMEDSLLVGIFSERDYARRGVLQGRDAKVTVEEVMTPDVYILPPDKTMEDAMALMITRKIRHVPVVENNKVIGIISIGDVVRNIIDEQRLQIHGLENYIIGRERSL